MLLQQLSTCHRVIHSSNYGLALLNISALHFFVDTITNIQEALVLQGGSPSSMQNKSGPVLL